MISRFMDAKNFRYYKYDSINTNIYFSQQFDYNCDK